MSKHRRHSRADGQADMRPTSRRVRIVELAASTQKKSISSDPAEPRSMQTPVKVKREEEESIIVEQPLVKSPASEEPPNGGSVVMGGKLKQEPLHIAGILESGEEWPFQGLCEQLCLDLFSPKWEIRHGAAIGLRAILKIHGSGAGKLIGLTPKINASRHRAWLEDVAIRLLCVLALDRFGDYGSDQAVAPVRETAAQTLGVVMQWSDRDLCLRMVNDGLLKLLRASEEASLEPDGRREKGWQVRHGALVGLKYWMAVRKDLLGDVFRPTKSGDESPIFGAIINGYGKMC